MSRRKSKSKSVEMPTHPGFKNLTGKKFGRICVVSYAGRSTNDMSLWHCLCKCGTQKIIRGASLSTGVIKSCGCLKSERCKRLGKSRTRDISGMKSHALTAIKQIKSRGQRVAWECKCQCGNFTTALSWQIVSKTKKSCGCLKKINTVKHGKWGIPEYTIWAAMIQRCTNKENPAYQHYGGRGVKVCKEWKQSFSAFLSDVGYRPSSHHEIDRFPDNDGDYRPGNVRWATRAMQMRNTRRNHMITHNGKTQCITDWADELGISRSTLVNRIWRGWSAERALTTPS